MPVARAVAVPLPRDPAMDERLGYQPRSRSFLQHCVALDRTRVSSQGPCGARGWSAESQGQVSSEVDAGPGALGTATAPGGRRCCAWASHAGCQPGRGPGPRGAPKCKQLGVGSSALPLLKGLPLREAPAAPSRNLPSGPRGPESSAPGPGRASQAQQHWLRVLVPVL